MKQQKRLQKNIGFAERDLQLLLAQYQKSKTKAGFGAFIALRILGDSTLKSIGWNDTAEVLPEKSKKTAKLSFRCTQKQLMTFHNYYSQSTAKSMGDFFDNAVKRSKIITTDKKSLPAEQVLEINRIGHNINQIARKVNTLSPGGPDSSVINEIHQELRTISELLKNILA